MSIPVTINPKTGLGEVENPYPHKYNSMYDEDRDRNYYKFRDENPPLPVITAAFEILSDGRYECDKVTITWELFRVKGNYYNQVWKVIETPELPAKETTLDQHIAEMHTLMEGKETVEELAERYYWSDDAIKHDGINRINHAYIAGYKEALAHSIDRDKVIAVIKEKFYKSNWKTSDDQIRLLTDLLQVIKAM